MSAFKVGQLVRVLAPSILGQYSVGRVESIREEFITIRFVGGVDWRPTEDELKKQIEKAQDESYPPPEEEWVIQDYLDKYGYTFTSFQMDERDWARAAKLMKETLKGKRGPIRDKDLGFDVPPGAKI